MPFTNCLSVGTAPREYCASGPIAKGRVPRRSLPAGFFEDPLARRDDEAGLFGDAMKAAGGTGPRSGCFQRTQGLNLRDPTVAEGQIG